MPNLKDTDIDDLLRRASDKYPLRTDSASWDRMAAALEKEPPVPPDGAVDAEEKRKKRRFFWLFLLLPLAGAGYYTLHHSGNVGKVITSGTVITSGKVAPSGNAVTPAAAATPNASASPTTPNASASTITPNASASTTTPANTTARANTTASTTPAAATTTAVAPTVSASKTNPNSKTNPTSKPNLATATSKATPATGQNQPVAATATGHSAAGHGAAGTKTPWTASIKTHRSHSNVDNIAEEEAQPENSLSLTAANGRQQPGGGNDRLFYDLQRAAIPRDYRLAVDVTAPATKKDSTAKPKAKTKHFYAGVFGSPDLSTVKMQSVKGVGTTFGLILGYTFNGGHWAIETGAYVDRKKYYTDGEYFNTKEIHLPANSWLTDVNGICYMWEIPLNVRYNFNPGAKTSWFATAGFSTYLMSHEKYAYGLEWMGNPNVYDSSWNFHKSSQYPFSIINLSAGFEQRLGKIGNLRVEPYVRLPLTGLGTGKLPIMSAGVNIGITRQLW